MSDWLRRIRLRVRATFARDAIDQDLQSEMRAHLDLEAEEIARLKNLPPDEARRQAAAAFGGVLRFTEEHHDARGVTWLFELWEDVRYSARALLRAPAFTLSAVLVLALGIGAATAAFSAVDAVLLRRLPYPNDEELVRIFQQNGPNRWTLSAVDVQGMERFSRSFAAIGAMRGGEVGVSAGGDAERLSVGWINAGWARALRVTPAAGRLLIADDERPESTPVALLAHRYAVAHFGSPENAIDRTVTVDGTAHRVVGVLSAADVRLGLGRSDVWAIMKTVTPARRGPFGIFSIARLRPGVTIDAARRDLASVSERIFPDWRVSFQDSLAHLTPYSLRETFVGLAKRPLGLFVAAVALVLLIAITNVASLGIVRSLRRWREISLRATLGASRTRLVRLIVTEGIVLGIAGGVAGLFVGWAGLNALQRLAIGIPRLDTARVDARVVLVGIVVALVAGLAVGVVPALRVLRDDRADRLRDGSRSIGDNRSTSRVRGVFVAAEFALALPVLASGALLLNSVLRLQRVNPGFDPTGVYTMSVSLPAGGYSDSTQVAAFWTRLSSQIGQLPGVRGAGFGTMDLPNDDGNNNNNFDLVDSPAPPGAGQPTVTWPSVTNEFFTALNVRLLEGRWFTAADTLGAVPVAIATRSWANRFYPGKSAIGRELIGGGCIECPHIVIVGIVNDVTQDGLGSPGQALFNPLSQGWPTTLNLYVRTSAPGPAFERGARDAIRSADPSAAMGVLSTLNDKMYESIAQPRHLATILMMFAFAGLLMAAVGIFGLLSYAVALRRREIGVRMALGAQAGAVVRSMIAAGMRFAIGGAVVGLVLTVVASRWLSDSLYGISAVDPMTLFAATAGLLGVALVASWLPARRAATIAPVEAMQPE